jgi:two-component system response regulator GlrR
LDEIGDMPAPLQVKLLRVLQERKVRPLGSNRDIDINVRIISATHRDLPKVMARNEFREDLYYRVNCRQPENPGAGRACGRYPAAGKSPFAPGR